MCSIEGEEQWTVWRELPRVAGKQHRCDGCWSIINKGEPYLSHANLFDGHWTSQKACLVCWGARSVFSAAHGWWEEPSRLIERLRECVGTNDDEEDEWRPVLAGVLRRYRTSPRRRELLLSRRGGGK
jgi:hypothetical protein